MNFGIGSLVEYLSKPARAERAALRERFEKAIEVLMPLVGVRLQDELELDQYYSDEYKKSEGYGMYVVPHLNGMYRGEAAQVIKQMAEKLSTEGGVTLKAAKAIVLLAPKAKRVKRVLMVKKEI